MSQASESVAESLHSGDYIKEARSWYFSCYKIVHLHAFLITLISITSFCIAITIGSLIVENYYPESYPFALYFDESQDVYYSHIKPLAKNNEPVNVSIARYLASRYVISRESYNPTHFSTGEWEEKVKMIKNLSSHHTFNQYARSIDVKTNLQSPIIKYKLHTRRDIKIKNVRLTMDYSGMPIGAIVDFIATETTEGKEKTTNNLVANIEFSMTDVEQFEPHNKIQLQFITTRYTLEGVNQ